MLHFVVVGAVLFAGYELINGGELKPYATDPVHIGEGEIRCLKDTFAKQWQRPPTEEGECQPNRMQAIVSRDDKALRFSDFIAGGKERLGSYSDDAELTALGAVVIDLTDVKAADRSNHAKFAQLAQIAPEMQQVFEGGVAAQEKPEAVKGQETLVSVVEGPGGLGVRIIRADQ